VPAYSSPPRNPVHQYSNLRQVLSPEYAGLPSAEIRVLMEANFGPESAENYETYLEGIFDDIGKTFSSAASDVGRFAAKAAPVIATVGGGALQGALAGSALGLPGIIAGAAAGGTGAALSKYGSGTARKIGGALTGVTGLAGQFSPMGRLGGSLGGVVSGLAGGGGGRGAAGGAPNILGGLLGGGAGGATASALGGFLGGGSGGGGGAGQALGALTSLFGGTGASGQLMSLLRRPETMQALSALNLGAVGRRTVPVGSAQTPIPVSAITNLIGQLANQAAVEAAAFSDGAEGELRYMTDNTGEFVGDPALDRDRAGRVWELMNTAQAERLVNAVTSYREAAAEREDSYYRAAPYVDSEAQEADLYDALDLAEIDTLYSDQSGEDLMEYDGEDLGEDYGELEESELYA
jgi:hypothetical protein